MSNLKLTPEQEATLKEAAEKQPYEPSPEELEEMFQAQQESEEEEFEAPVDTEYEDHSILMHCKPVYNFQSIEFDIVVDTSDPESMEEMKGVYRSVLNILQSVAVDQPAQVKPRALPSEEDRPTPKMLEIMDRFGIAHDQYTTKKQAQSLIEKSMKENK